MKLRKRRAERRFAQSKVLQKFEERAAALDAATVAAGGDINTGDNDTASSTVATAAGNSARTATVKKEKDGKEEDDDNRSKAAAASARTKKKKKENADIDFKAVFDDDGILLTYFILLPIIIDSLTISYHRIISYVIHDRNINMIAYDMTNDIIMDDNR